jgi:hypothetical protein
VDAAEFPASWFADLPEALFRSRRYHVPTNCYGVKSGFGQRSGRARVGYTCKTLEDGSSGTAASTWADAAPTTRASVHAGARAPHHAAGGGTSFAVPSLAMVAAGRTPPSRRSSARRCCTGHTS